MTPDPAALFDLAPAAYVVLDPDGGQMVAANEAFLSLVGRPRDEVLSRTLVGMLSVGGRIYYETHLMPMLELNGRVDEVAVEVLAADGARIPVLLNARLDRSCPEGSQVLVVLFAARERRRYETELLRVTREAVHARERAVELAMTLQETLIPPVPPEIPGLGISAVYRPAGAGDEVGGDFYDVFSVSAGEWVVVLGDVAGKGVAAATVTSFLRHTVRDLAMHVPDPAELLTALDRALRAQDTDRFCTIVVLRLRETPDGWSLVGSAGGHPLPLLGRLDGTVVELGTPGALIGILDRATFTTFEHHLTGDEFVTLYTDGVSEARRGRTLLGDDALRALVTAAAADPSRVSDAVVEAALAFQDGVPRDDIAVLTLWPTKPTQPTDPVPI